MSFDFEKRSARRLLAAIEDGVLGTADTFHLIGEADPTLVHFIFEWIRAWYPASHPAADAVLGRLGEVCTRYPKAVQIAKSGGSDPLVAWFLDEYRYRDLRADEFIDLIVEKLEG